MKIFLMVFFLCSSVTFAAITKADFDAQVVDVLYNQEVKTTIELRMRTPPPGVIMMATLKSRLYDNADQIFAQYGSRETTTRASIKGLVASSWGDIIQSIRNGNDAMYFGTNDAMDFVIVALRNAQAQAGISNQQNNGNLTPAQALAARQTAVAQANAAQQQLNEESKKTKCISFTSFSVSACINDFVTWFIKSVFVEIAGFGLWLTSNMFGHVMKVGVLEFKTWASDALYPIWVLVRQIISLGVVFIGLYLGFMYILGREDKFAKYLPWVIMFALFVNFSYPVARFAVDVSNVVTLNVYTAAFSNEALNGQSNDTVGAIIMNRLGLSNLVMAATTVNGSGGTDLLKEINTIPGALLTVVFVLYAAYVFFMATALIAMRTAALVFLIVASPFLFIDSVLPFLGDKAMQIRKIFFEQLAVGPVFVILLALTLKFITIFADGGALAKTNAISGGSSKDVVVFFNIFMMLVMLHLTLKITKSVSGTIGQMATNAMGKVGGFATGAALGVATGGAGLLARGTIGRAASKLRDSKWVTNNQDSFLGRRAYEMSNSVAKSSFDLRNSSVIAGGMNKLGMTGVGKGRTAGYEEAMEKRKQAILEKGSRIKTRYERDVRDPKTGEIIHRAGDIDVEAERAQERYIARAGGTLFMPKEEKEKVREQLGKKAEEESKKVIDKAKANSAPEVALYKSAADKYDANGMKISAKVQKENMLAEMRGDLEKLKKTDPSMRGEQTQSLLQSIQEIEKIKVEEEIKEAKEKISQVKGDKVDERGKTVTSRAQKEEALVKLREELGKMKANDPGLHQDATQNLIASLNSLQQDINDSEIDKDLLRANKLISNITDDAMIDGRKVSVKTQKNSIVSELEANLAVLEKSDPNRKNPATKKLSDAIEKLKQNNEETESTFEKELTNNIAKYQNVVGSKDAIIPRLDEELNTLISRDPKMERPETRELNDKVKQLKMENDAEKARERAKILNSMTGRMRRGVETEINKTSATPIPVTAVPVKNREVTLISSPESYTSKSAIPITSDIDPDTLEPIPIAEKNWDDYELPPSMRGVPRPQPRTTEESGTSRSQSQSAEELGAMRAARQKEAAEAIWREEKRNQTSASNQGEVFPPEVVAEERAATERARNSSRGEGNLPVAEPGPFTPRPLTPGALSGIRAAAAERIAARRAATNADVDIPV